MINHSAPYAYCVRRPQRKRKRKRNLPTVREQSLFHRKKVEKSEQPRGHEDSGIPGPKSLCKSNFPSFISGPPTTTVPSLSSSERVHTPPEVTHFVVYLSRLWRAQASVPVRRSIAQPALPVAPSQASLIDLQIVFWWSMFVFPRGRGRMAANACVSILVLVFLEFDKLPECDAVDGREGVVAGSPAPWRI